MIVVSLSDAGLCFSPLASVAASPVELSASVATASLTLVMVASLTFVVAVTLGRLWTGGVG